MTTYTGSLDGRTLTLRWPPAGLQVLRRRDEAAAPQPAAAPSPDLGGLTQPPAATGVWVWQWRAIDANGDERLELEEWHLSQQGATVRGRIERRVRLVNGAGAAFSCSGRPDYAIVMRYDVVGELRGQRIQLTEVGVGQSDGSPCGPEHRGLLRYEGEVGVEEMLLSTGASGRERRVLRRLRPQTDLQGAAAPLHARLGGATLRSIYRGPAAPLHARLGGATLRSIYRGPAAPLHARLGVAALSSSTCSYFDADSNRGARGASPRSGRKAGSP
jgi:hypothetical protein